MEPGVRCTDLGQNISRILITIHLQKLDNALCLGFPSAMIIENVRSALEFTGRHANIIDNQKVITKHE